MGVAEIVALVVLAVDTFFVAYIADRSYKQAKAIDHSQKTISK